jgi:hypothetical protein
MAMALPGWEPAADGHSAHVVQFYGGPYPVEAIAGFLRQGLAVGEVGIVVATPEHILEVQTKLGGSGRCVFLDAKETMAKFMIDGHPDRTRFMDTVGDLVSHAAQIGNGKVRAFGEMVVLLCEQGEPQAAHELEMLWNELGRMHALRLLCSYPLAAVSGPNKEFGDLLRDDHSHAVLA